MNNENKSQEAAAQLFDNNFDCYADTGSNPHIHPKPAITKEKFLKVISAWKETQGQASPIAAATVGFTRVDAIVHMGEYDLGRNSFTDPMGFERCISALESASRCAASPVSAGEADKNIND